VSVQTYTKDDLTKLQGASASATMAATMSMSATMAPTMAATKSS